MESRLHRPQYLNVLDSANDRTRARRERRRVARERKRKEEEEEANQAAPTQSTAETSDSTKRLELLG